MLESRSNLSVNRKGELDAAIEGLYSTFAHKHHGPVTGCSHCTSSADDQRLRAKPLRHLTGEDLSRFASKAVTTLGTVHDLKQFLPRLLEIASQTGDVGGADFQIVLGKLSYAEWTGWPDFERATIDQYLRALWLFILGDFPAIMDVETCLCGIAMAVNDLGPFLSLWEADISLSAMRHLADMVECNNRKLAKRRQLHNAFWREPQMHQAVNWLIQPKIILRLQEAFFECTDDQAAGELSQAVQTLEWLQSRFLGEQR